MNKKIIYIILILMLVIPIKETYATAGMGAVIDQYMQETEGSVKKLEDEAKKLSEKELTQKIKELTDKETRQGTLTQEEKKQKEVYEKVYTEKVTNKQIEDKDNKGGLLDPIQNPDAYKPTEDTSSTKLKNMANDLVGAMRALGTILAIVILIIMGYKYMIGSVSDRADFKKAMIPYLIGAILLFTIPNLVGILYDLIKGINI